MNYFLDTEFLEGPQKNTGLKRTWTIVSIITVVLSISSVTFFEIGVVASRILALSLISLVIIGIKIDKTKFKPTIDLISIGIVSEDGREYYAISKDFNLKEAWNRFQWKEFKINETGDIRDFETKKIKEYWIRENVLRPVWEDLRKNQNISDRYLKFTYKSFKKLLNKYGKSNDQIAEEIKYFTYCNEKINNDFITSSFRKENSFPVFYAYYADYDWVVFCWLFGRMMDLPKGFPMFAFDIQQLIKDNNINKEELIKKIPQEGVHNSLQDAIWNKKAFNYIQTIINEKRTN